MAAEAIRIRIDCFRLCRIMSDRKRSLVFLYESWNFSAHLCKSFDNGDRSEWGHVRDTELHAGWMDPRSGRISSKNLQIWVGWVKEALKSPVADGICLCVWICTQMTIAWKKAYLDIHATRVTEDFTIPAPLLTRPWTFSPPSAAFSLSAASWRTLTGQWQLTTQRTSSLRCETVFA